MNPTDQDIEFLLNRAMKAGSFSTSNERDTGLSSNSIVAIAYGLKGLHEQILPIDQSDLRACERMWLKLPPHRMTPDAKEAMNRAWRALEVKA
jgi:hypothetical protein